MKKKYTYQLKRSSEFKTNLFGLLALLIMGASVINSCNSGHHAETRTTTAVKTSGH